MGALRTFWRSVCRRLRAINDLPVDPGAAKPSLLVSRPVKPNVDYSRFDRLLKDAEEEEVGLSVAVCGRKGSNKEAVNGVYLQDGTLNGCPRLKKNDGTRWLKFTDDKKWMISRYPDGRPLGEAYAEPSVENHLRSDPKAIPGPWFVYSKDKWEEDQLMSVTPANCAGCGKLLQRLQRCSQCRAVSYCDHSCQKGDWQFHKRLCSKRSWKLPDEGDCYAVPENPDESSRSMKKDVEMTAGICAPRSFSQKDGLSFDRRLKVRSGQNWEERDLLGWSKQRLEILFEGPEEREGLPALRVLCKDGGRVEVATVNEIDGLASVWPGDSRHLFDLSFQVVFKAFWLSDFSLMSMDGTVSFRDFTTDLVDSSEPFVCGMFVDFAQNSECPKDEPRTVMQTTMPPTSKAAIQEALGADAWRISRGEGLMHLVHLRLKHFAKEFEAQ
eukprot:Skav208181  [mRNA]  locus=scaffold2530:197906:199225:+ [translate_table: standard]